MGSTCPVMYPLSALARKSTALAMSAGWANRPRGICFTYSARISGRHGRELNKGLDGYFNCAFFDGHVVTLSTEPYSLAGRDLKALDSQRQDTIFLLHNQ